MQAINIFSAHFSLRIKDGTILKVGDPVFLLIKRFPNSWANKQSPNQLFVSLRDQNVFVDMNLVFDIDPKTNKIKEIALQ
jgi:hypothetical protein